MRQPYEQFAELADLLRRTGELSAKTVIFDVEPLVAGWDSGQEALDRGVADVAAQAAAVPGVAVVCFATNAERRPSRVPAAGATRVMYLAGAGKPLRTARYRDLPGPGVVIGDQLATDGALAWRLGYAFLQYRPRLDHVPAGPRLMGQVGRLVRPVLFTRPGRVGDGR